MSIRRVGTHSAIYTVSTLLQKALGVILLPLYARCLTPDEYGSIAVVTAIATILAVVCSFGMDVALVRVYPEVRDDEPTRKRFLGTIVVAVGLASLVVAGALILAGEWLLQPILGRIPFFPLAALGLVAVAFLPVIDVLLSYLQATEQAVRFSLLAIASFLLKVGLSIALVVGIPLGAVGALTAQAIAVGVVCAAGLWLLRRDLTWTLDRALLARAFAFGRAVAPQSIASSAKGVVDRVLVGGLTGLAAAGVYNVGFQFAALVQVLVVSVNRALLPVFVAAMRSDDPSRIDQMRSVSRLIASLHCFAALAVSLFAPEAILVVAGPDYASAALVVPPVAFAFAALGVQSIFGRELLLSASTARWISITGVASVVVATGLNLLVIPAYGIMGAALVALLAQVAQTTTLGWVSHRLARTTWQPGPLVAIYVATLAIAVLAATHLRETSIAHVAVKALVLTVAGQLLLAVSGGRDLFAHGMLKRLSWIR